MEHVYDLVERDPISIDGLPHNKPGSKKRRFAGRLRAGKFYVDAEGLLCEVPPIIASVNWQASQSLWFSQSL
jgi:hypothetical protein